MNNSKKVPLRSTAKGGEETQYDLRMISAKKTPEKSRYPIHYLVWHNKHRQLEKELAANEQVRPRGATKHLLIVGGLPLNCGRFYFIFLGVCFYACYVSIRVKGALKVPVPVMDHLTLKTAVNCAP